MHQIRDCKLHSTRPVDIVQIGNIYFLPVISAALYMECTLNVFEETVYICLAINVIYLPGYITTSLTIFVNKPT